MQRALVLGCLGAVIGVAACTPGGSSPASGIGVNQSAIIGGTTDTGDPSVVLLIGQAPGSMEASLCTAEVVSAHAILTAAHCVDPATVGTGKDFFIFLGDNIMDTTQNVASNFIDVTSTVYNTAFDPNNLMGGNDTAIAGTLVTIPRTPLVVNTTPITDADVNQNLRVVGFGISSGTDSTGTTAGVKRQVTTPLLQYDAMFLEFGSATQNTCEGDSGGPAFIMRGGVEVIGGITSFGDQGCTQGGFDTRVDAYWTSFIQPNIATAEAAAANADMAGVTGDMASSSTSPDMAQSAVTSDGGATNLGIGAACTDASQCSSGACTTGHNRYCTESCTKANPNSCPNGFTCENVNNAPFCVLPEHGCSAGARSPGNAALLLPLLLLAGFALLRRRRADNTDLSSN
jgi:MYXO-CTERM domain-containing protein